jgi:hypothetical protein
MGKYKCKYEWKTCEFTYKNRWFGKERGDPCGGRARNCYEGKYFCSFHCPKRILIRKQKNSLIGIEKIAQQEARIQERKKRFYEMFAAMDTSKQEKLLFRSALSRIKSLVV